MSTKYPGGTRPFTLDELRWHLAQFSGTERYHCTHPGLLATDGAKCLADVAGADWLLDIIWSVLPKIADEFAVLELSLEEVGEQRAWMRSVYQAVNLKEDGTPAVKRSRALQRGGGIRPVILNESFKRAANPTSPLPYSRLPL